MTVLVRQIAGIQITKVTPPVPPTPPVMFFITQPTDTIERQLFEPEIMVGISDQGLDSLTISAAGPQCSDIQPVTVIANVGGAIFLGLRAGEDAIGCRLRVHNNTRPEIEDIFSDPFDVLEEPPPPVPTMTFMVPPMNTVERELFQPEVKVSISDNGLDSLTASAAEPQCSDIQPVTVTATATGATFVGLRAGEDAIGCRLRVRNNSRPEVADIFSDPFDILEEPPPALPFELIDAEYVQAAANTSVASFTLDTVGAALIVIAMGGNFSGAATNMTSTPSITLASTPYQHPTNFQTREIGMRFFYWLNPNPALERPNHLFSVTLDSVAGPTTPVMWGFSFAARRPVTVDGTSGNALLNVSTIQALDSLNINFNDAIALTAGFSNIPGSPFIFPLGYQMFFQPSDRFPLAFGFRFPPNPTLVNPVWSTISTGTLVMTDIAFRAAP